MKPWNDRAPELANLLNPPFCARLLYTAVKAYTLENKQCMPFPLIYLVLPIALHKETRLSVNSISKMSHWIAKHPEHLVGFDQRARFLVQITNEAMEYLLMTNYVAVDEKACIYVNPNKRGLSETRLVCGDTGDCIKCARSIGKWFARSGDTKTIYISWGVRP